MGGAEPLVSNLLSEAAWPAPVEQGQRHGQVTTLGRTDLKEKNLKPGGRKEAQIERGFSETELKIILSKF